MTDQRDIWNRLKDYEILPPQDLGRELLKRIQVTHQMEADHSMDRLMQYEVQPPAALRESITKRIAHASSRGKHRNLYWYGAVAACVVLLMGVAAIYKLTGPESLQSTRGKRSPPTRSAQRQEPVRGTNQVPGADSLNDLSVMATVDSQTLGRAGSYRTSLPASIEGHSLTLVDNDLLATFASYPYTELPAWMKRTANQDLKIHVDQYTNILVAKRMVEMIKDMQQYRANGKPTRKARRARERLATWKKADEQKFDSHRRYNPLDPLDLAGFIFK